MEKFCLVPVFHCSSSVIFTFLLVRMIWIGGVFPQTYFLLLDSVASLQGGYPLFLSLHLIYRSITVPSIVREEEATGRKTRVTSVTTNNIHDYFRVLAYAYTSRWSENKP